MLLLFRFLLVALRARLRSRIGPLEESTVRFTALPHDCDLNLHLNAGRYISFMDAARLELIVRMRLMHKLLRRGWRPVMGGTAITYRRSILPMERFSIVSRVVGWDEKWFYMEHAAYKRDGSLSATALVRMIIRSRHGSIPTRDVLALIGQAGLASPALPERLP
jgi:acyl-CoA thioesterase FadM